MRWEIRSFIHEMDLITDQTQNVILLEIAAGIREILSDYPEEDTEQLIDPMWMTKCIRLCRKESKEEQSKPESLLHFIYLLSEPGNSVNLEAESYMTADIRNACIIQRNRIRFLYGMVQIAERLVAYLPEAEKREAKDSLMRSRQTAEEHFECLLSLYRQKSKEEHSKTQRYYLEKLEGYGTKPDERDDLADMNDKVGEIRKLIHEREKKLNCFFNTERIYDHNSGLSECTNTERRMSNVQGDISFSEAEEKVAAEGD